MTYESILFINLFSSVFMTGLIWFVQLVHYPSFAFAGEPFSEFHRHHSFFTGLIVMPVMIIELLSSGWLWHQEDSLFELNSIGFYIVILIWVSTALFQVPVHRKLSKEKDSELIKKLVQTNWIRTFLWTIKAILTLLFIINK